MKIKEYNALAIISFLLALGIWLSPLFFSCCINGQHIISAIALVAGIVSLIWIKVKKEKGYLLAIMAIIFGLLGFIYLF